MIRQPWLQINNGVYNILKVLLYQPKVGRAEISIHVEFSMEKILAERAKTYPDIYTLYPDLVFSIHVPSGLGVATCDALGLTITETING